MTNQTLRTRLIAAGAAVIVILFISLSEYLTKDANNKATFVGSNATLFALLFAAYLTYVFQQRGKFVDELRGWWNEMVEAKSLFFVYCDKKNPTEEDYLKGFYALSTSMDTLRLIYCNVRRSGQNPKGYYPFEQVRDIIDVARSIAASESPTAQDRTNAKEAINLVFQSLRHAIQAEANASVPDNPTAFDSPHREKYVKEIQSGIGLDLSVIRKANQAKTYFSRREKTT
ncbi:hypothetical protein CV770_35565 [Bradyrhizobium sp. AC87j1]|uniref:hypothetical protein n=1 Tax=Bradyrhizobium sp. AC87j1 TaxID=2055894 RepID=UPI000CECBF24|nr:hypothetical protein [Bradyrhizobium sp. AC87j1]PPQ14702.1 hypothetical protein CV770_35565 [Bradyrhizobium sp. AC87j1]